MTLNLIGNCSGAGRAVSAQRLIAGKLQARSSTRRPLPLEVSNLAWM